MKPTLPEPIAKALAYFRATSAPYFNGAILDDAEHQLRLAILKHANPLVVAALRAFRKEWDAAPPGTDWPAAAKLGSWHRLMDEMGYDRDVETMQLDEPPSSGSVGNG
jgi:hypothetical protein